MQNKLLLLLVLSLLSPVPSFAGRLVGNGGDGVLIDDKIYLLDLVEAGVEAGPFFSVEKEKSPLVKFSSQKLRSLQGFPLSLFQFKMAELERKSPIFAHALGVLSNELNWNLVAAGLLPIDDEDSPLSQEPGKLVQLAARRGNTIYLDRALWSKLDGPNKVALVFHELIYTLTPPTIVTSSPKESRQLSLSARALNGIIFKQDWDGTETDSWAVTHLFQASPVQNRSFSNKNPNFVYSFTKEKFARSARPDFGSVVLDGNYSLTSEFPNSDLWMNACAGTKKALLVKSKFIGIKLAPMIRVNPYGEEWKIQQENYCQSLDAAGNCVFQIYYKFSLVRPFSGENELLRSIVYRPRGAGSFLLGRSAREGLDLCMEGLKNEANQLLTAPFSAR